MHSQAQKQHRFCRVPAGNKEEELFLNSYSKKTKPSSAYTCAEWYCVAKKYSWEASQSH